MIHTLWTIEHLEHYIEHQFYLMIRIQPSAHRIIIRHNWTRDRCTITAVKVKDRRWFWIWHSNGIVSAFIQTLFSCTKFLIELSAKFFKLLILSRQFVYFRYQLGRVIVRPFICSLPVQSVEWFIIWKKIGLCNRTCSYKEHLWLLIDQYLDFWFEQ